MTPRLRAAAVLATIAAATAAGCGEDFDPYTRLTALRVLAIKSEVMTQPAAPNGAYQVTPGPGDTATLSALMFVPEGDMPTFWQWRWCPIAGPATTGYECLFQSAEELQAATGVTVPDFNLGNAETAQFTHNFPPEAIAALCVGIPGVAPPVNCEGGFPIQIELRVESLLDPGIDVVYTLRLRIDSTDPALPPMPPNYNPVAAMVDPIGAILPGGGPTPTPIPDDGTDPAVTLRRDRPTRIVVGLSDDQAESYPGLEDDDNDDMPTLTTLRERLTLSWFVESGDPDFDRTGFIDGVEPIEDAVRNDWTPAKVREYAPDTARIVVIVRDNRGGADVIRGRVRLEASP
jgi:hypothetical protein